MAFVIPAAATYFAAAATTSIYVSMALYASAALQVVGGITENEDLQKLGAIVGIGAGIYGAATGAFGAGAIAGEAGAEVAATTVDGYTAAERAAESAMMAGDYAGTGVTGAAIDTGTASGKVLANVVPTQANAPTAMQKVADAAKKKTDQTGGGGIFDKIASNPNSVLGFGMAAQGLGPPIAGAFDDSAEQKIALEQDKLDREQANIDYRRANMNGIIKTRLRITPNDSASIFPNQPGVSRYRSPAKP